MNLIYRRPAPLIIPPSHGRSTGRIHLTEILHHIEDKLGTWDKYDSDFESREMQLKTAMGLAWEEWFSETTYGKPPINGLYHFGEIERDGIVGTPDGLSATECAGCGELVEVVDEFKCSRFGMGEGKDIQELFDTKSEWTHRVMQTQSYCAILGCRHARFWIYFVCGNYQRGADRISVAFDEFLVEYTEKEVEQTWQMVLNHREAVELERTAI